MYTMVAAYVETIYFNINVFYFSHNILKPLIVYSTQHGSVRTELQKLSTQMLIYFPNYTHNHLTIEYVMVTLTFS